MKSKLLFLIFFFFVLINAFAGYKWAHESGSFKPVPVQLNKSIPDWEIEDGCYFMLMDFQLDLSKKQKYYHYAYKLTSNNGVQNYSEIQIEYNPAYEKLLLNSIKVYRNGKFIDYTSNVKIKEIQREEDLEYHIYDETLTVYIILEDIRIGDVVEYSYTKEGFNPIFDDFFYGSYSYQLSYTLIDFYLRIVKPRDLKLYIKNHRSDLKPTSTVTKTDEELIWKKSNIPGVKYEELTPLWYNTHSIIEISSSDNWAEIRKWGIKVFNNDEPLSDDLKNVCRKIRMEQKKDADRVIAALRFVQKKIRYLGIEIGVNSHKPNSPNKTFKQGFGDCKDKSLLLTKMLHELGIEAYPALVSTTDKAHIMDYLPSPKLFNHTVVNVVLNGKTYWFDPTITNQQGDINNSYFRSYGYALVLGGSGSALDVVLSPSFSSISIKENIIVKDLNNKATLNVFTTYTGAEADDIRYTFATNSLKEIQDNYLNFYKNTYLQIDTAGKIFFTDDSVNNKIKVTESYVINDFWKSEDSLKKNIITAVITAYDINSKIEVFQNKYASRKAPLSLEYPLDLEHSFIITLPEEWDLKPDNQIIDNDFFSFFYNESYRYNTINLTYHLVTKKDHVKADKSSAFMADINKVKNSLSYQLTYNKSAKMEGLNVYTFISFLVFIIILGFTFFKFFKKKEKADLPSDYITHETIGGWVILPIIGLVLTPIIALFSLVKNKYFSVSLWQTAIDYQSGIYPIAILSQILLQSIYIVLPVALLILAFRYDRRFPRYMIHFYFLNIIINLIDIVIFKMASDFFETSDYKQLTRSIIAACIWIPFFIKSERCKRTFVK